jgi:hypothetical protein
MTIEPMVNAPRAYARAAGALYLLIIVCGIFSEALVRSSLIVAGDADATAAKVLASPGLFHAGFAADVVMLLSDVAIAIVFYILLKPVSGPLALTAAAFRLVQAALVGSSLLFYYSALILLAGGYANAFPPSQLHALALFMLDMHSHGYDVGLLFFGVSSLILGYLVVRSAYFPSLLGYGLMAAAVVYLAGSLARFLLPESLPLIMPLYIVPLAAELAFCLWLLIKGVAQPRPA